MGRSLKITNSQYQIKPVLDNLRSTCGDSEFGYRMQALFAHVMIGLGAVITEINAQGHPDIRAKIGDRDLLIQVKTSKHSSSATEFELSEADFRGISTQGTSEGILAYLDCAEPVNWIVVPNARARRLVGKSVHVATLRADADELFSDECTEVFTEIILNFKDRLGNLTYSILRRRALEGFWL